MQADYIIITGNLSVRPEKIARRNRIEYGDP